MAKNGNLDRQTIGASYLKHGMHTQLDLGVTWVESLLATLLPIGV